MSSAFTTDFLLLKMHLVCEFANCRAQNAAHRFTERLGRVLHRHQPMAKVEEGPFSWLEDIWKQICCSVSGTLSCVSVCVLTAVHAL